MTSRPVLDNSELQNRVAGWNDKHGLKNSLTLRSAKIQYSIENIQLI
jgi:hypothetical protein